jgi:hypothetical protein
MEKLVCILWADDGADRAAFHARLVAELPVRLLAAGASRVRINVDDAAVAAGAQLRQSRGERQPDATVQFWLPSANALFRGAAEAALGALSARWAGWVVAESTIIANAAHPPRAGVRTEGFAQLAFLVRPHGMAHDDWLAAWQDRHTAVAIETQSNFEYVQNLVIRALTPDAPPYAAIVEECFPPGALTDPLLFFDAPGDIAKFRANLARMMASCDSFITRGAIDVIPTSQYDFA